MKSKSAAKQLGPIAVVALAALAVLNLGESASARPVADTGATMAQPAAAPVQIPSVSGGVLLADAQPVGDTAAPPAAFPPPPPPPPAPAPVLSEGEAAMQTHTAGKNIEKFRADNLDLKTALALFASQNDLNIVPDNDIVGTVTLDVHNLPLDQMMDALLEAGDCSWEEHNGLIRVRNIESRTFVVDYLRLKRNGLGNNSATLSDTGSGTVSGAGGAGGSGGFGGSNGGGGGGSMGGSSGGSGGVGVGNPSSSAVNITADNTTDFWTELRTELMQLLTDSGRSSLAINKTAGIIEVTDRPSALRRIEHYLNSTQTSINRQVDIEAKIYDVTLNDEFQYGIDWNVVADYYTAYTGAALNGLGGIGASATALPLAVGTQPIQTVNTLNIGLTNVAGLLSGHPVNSSAAIQALKTQGNVEVLAQPRIRALNNQTAVIKVGEEVPLFSTTSLTLPGTSVGTSTVQQSTTASSVTIGTVLFLTPQISADGWVSMDVTPVLTDLKGIQQQGGTTAADTETKQASTLVRVMNDTTVVIGGLIQTEKDKSDNKVPMLGDIPVLGKALFSGTYRNKIKKELVIFLTPHIVAAGEHSVDSPKVVFEMSKDNAQLLKMK